MMMSARSMVAAALGWGMLVSGVQGAELSVRMTVQEPAGVARRNEPASGGLPFLKGQVKSIDELTLTDKDGKAVPAQFSKLAAYEDGSIQWALADFLADVPGNGRAEYVVRNGKATGPAKALDIKEDAAMVTVDTGAARFKVSKEKFSLLESVEVDGKTVAGPGGASLMNLELEQPPPAKPGQVPPFMVKAGGRAYPCQAGKPSRVLWEYRGPIRSTLRLDGEYEGEGQAKLSYTARLTFWAGLAAVRVEYSIRNSQTAEGYDAGIKEATVSLALGGPDTGSTKGKGRGWLAAGNDAGSVLVSHRHTGGCFPGNSPDFEKIEVADGKVVVHVIPSVAGSNKAPGYGDGFFALADCTHKDSQIWLEFGKDAVAAGEKRHQACVSKLHALADGAWVSQTGCMGYGRFGTLQDEIDTYKAWGWKGWDDPGKQANARRKADPYAYVANMAIHDESESDSAELGLLMYLRTGERGWFDLGEAYARYFKTHASYRTDGFEYDGFRHERAGVNQKAKRVCHGLGFGWYGPKQYGWSDTRLHMCHFWGNGIFDYYCLTGDMDALEGGQDIAEYAALTFFDGAPGKSTLGLGRAWGREFMCVTRAYELTRDARWKAACDQFGKVAIQAPNRDPSGLFFSPGGSYVPYFVRDVLESKKAPLPESLKALIQEKGITHKVERGHLFFTNKEGKKWEWWDSAQSFEFEACHSAIFRYAEITNDPEARKLAVDLARGARDMYWSKKCEHIIPHPYIGFPDEGKTYDAAVWSDEHKNCPGDNGGKHSGYHTRFFADVFAHAYALTGEKEWLDLARKAWNRGSKRGYWTPSQDCPDDEVKIFAGHSAPKGDQIDIRNSMRMFYEVPRAK